MAKNPNQSTVMELTQEEEARVLLDRRRTKEHAADLDYILAAGWWKDDVEFLRHDPMSKVDPPPCYLEIPKVGYDDMGRKSVVMEKVKQHVGRILDVPMRFEGAVAMQRERDRAKTLPNKPPGGEPFPGAHGRLAINRHSH